MIWLTDKIVVKADQHQYLVGRPKKQYHKDGTVTIHVDKPGYYTDLATAVKDSISRALRDGVADERITTLQEFVREHRRLQREFRELLQPLQDCF